MSKEKINVKVIKGDINRALKQYKRRAIQSGHLQEYKDRQEYVKPTTVRRKIKQNAIRNNKHKQQNDNL